MNPTFTAIFLHQGSRFTAPLLACLTKSIGKYWLDMLQGSVTFDYSSPFL